MGYFTWCGPLFYTSIHIWAHDGTDTHVAKYRSTLGPMRVLGGYKWSENSDNILNKAIRDGKYLARHMPVLGNVHPIKIENVDIFFVTSFLCSLEKYLKEIVSPVFETRY